MIEEIGCTLTNLHICVSFSVFYAMVYANQEQAALEILAKYTEGTIRYGLLRANEQSGKTGTYHTLIQYMFEYNLIDNAYIVCGSNEIELLSQCNADVREWHDRTTRFDKIHVVFRQNFKRIHMNTTRALIIVDESHLVQGVDQKLSEFIQRHGLTMAGTNPNMVENNTYILSVDATPYAEESAIVTNQCLPKFKVTLPDGNGYFGVKEYFESGLIHPTYELNSIRGKNSFTTLLQEYTRKYILVRIQEKRNKSIKWIKQYAELAGCDIKYFTSHFTKDKLQICLTKEQAKTHFKDYGQRIPCLEEAPEKTTIVFIDGRLRCGKRVPKKHVGFIWEASKSANTDVIRQSLLGRMSGYIGNAPCDGKCNSQCVGICVYKVPETKPLIFVPGRILIPQNSKKVIKMSDLERTIYVRDTDETILTPRFANNIIPGSIQNIAHQIKCDCHECVYNRRHHRQCHPFTPFIVTPCVPIRFKLDAEQINSLGSIDDSKCEGELNIKSQCLTRLMEEDRRDDILRQIRESQNLTQEQKDEILEKLDSFTAEQCHYRAYKGISSQIAHKHHVNAYENNSASIEHISEAPFLTFCVVHPGYTALEGVRNIPGEVYAIFYTKAEGNFKRINFESRISTVNKKTHFTIQPTQHVEPCPAGSVYGFSPKILSDTSQFYKEFDFFIKVAKSAKEQDIGLFSQRFTALYNGEYIRLPRSIYNLDILKTIFEQLEMKHSIKITFKLKRFRPTVYSEHLQHVVDHEINFIEWE